MAELQGKVQNTLHQYSKILQVKSLADSKRVSIDSMSHYKNQLMPCLCDTTVHVSQLFSLQLLMPGTVSTLAERRCV